MRIQLNKSTTPGYAIEDLGTCIDCDNVMIPNENQHSDRPLISLIMLDTMEELVLPYAWVHRILE